MPWLPASAIRTGGTLTFRLSATPNAAWGSAPTDSPPSFGTGQLPAVAYSQPSGSTNVTVGSPSTIELGVAPAGSQSTAVHWQLTPPPAGLTVTPSSGTLTVAASSGGQPSVSQPLALTASTPGSYALHFQVQTAQGVSLPPVVLDVNAAA